MCIVPASSSRAWMDATTERFANRCLPLKMANQAGWVLLNDRTFRATWDGGSGIPSVQLEFFDGSDGPPPYASSHFGHGILTWAIPYLFRTPPGYNLLAKGPANTPKDGASPLEGIAETDWRVATFTMNWKLTRPEHPVTFEAGEPVCMIVPQRRGELESFEPEVRDLTDDPEVAYDYWKWAESRWNAMAEGRHKRAAQKEEEEEEEEASSATNSNESRSIWQMHYVRGTSPTGIGSEEHQTKLRLRSFEERSTGKQREGEEKTDG